MKRKPKSKDGTIEFYWYEPHNGLNVTWGKVPEADVNLMFSWFEREVPGVRPEFQDLLSREMPPILAELEARGYDLSTFRMTIKKKKVVDEDE